MHDRPSQKYKALQRFDEYVRGKCYLPLLSGSELVDVCEEHDLAVLGIEGFLFDNDYVIPQMDLIGDFSPRGSEEAWPVLRRSCNRAAKFVIKEISGRDDVYLDFVVVCEHRWRELGSVKADS